MSASPQRQRFVRATLDELCRWYPSLGTPGRVRALAPSEGAANLLWQVELGGVRALLKVRSDPDLSVERETWALRLLRGRWAPRLLASARLQALVERAVRRRDLAAACALDTGPGDLLLMGWCPGRRAPRVLDDAQVAAVAQAIAALHGRRPRTGSRSPMPASPRALAALAPELLREIRGQGLLLDRAVATAARAVRAAQRHLEQASRRMTWRRVRVLCHGDLRWHNVVLDAGRAWLVDLEHAGIGDPAIDLALMSCRTPLSQHDELRLLDAYLTAAPQDALLDRYFALKPLLGVVAALAAVLDLGAVRDGARCAVDEPSVWLRARAPLVADELGAALERALGSAPARPRLRLRAPSRPASRAAGPVTIDGSAASLCSPLAARLAHALGWAHVDTGVLYRHAALLAWIHGRQIRDPVQRAALVRALRDSGARASADGALRVDGQRLSRVLATTPVERGVARWAACPEVRQAVGELLRPWLRTRRAVIEGRDVGSALLPAAPLKLFVDGPVAERAARQAARGGLPLPRAQAQLEHRDRLDRTRAVAPLVAAHGALRLRVREEQLDATVRRLQRRLEAMPC